MGKPTFLAAGRRWWGLGLVVWQLLLPLACQAPASPADSPPASPAGEPGAAADPARAGQTQALPPLQVATFNIRVFTTRSRSDRELEVIAGLVATHDLVLIQEARDQEVLDRLVREVEHQTGVDHDWRASPPLGRGVKELYVWVYRCDRLEALGDCLVYPDSQDRFIREPAGQRFRTSRGLDFLAVQVHLVFGDSKAVRLAEAGSLPEVLAWMAGRPEMAGDADLFLAGDFNLAPSETAFDALEALGYVSVKQDEGTTIADSPYDTFWLAAGLLPEYAGTWGMERFDEVLYDDVDDKASLEVSDHRPVWMLLQDGPDLDGPPD